MDLAWLDYGLRFYSPELARWFVQDSRADKYSSWSPYNYALNSPLVNVDPNGDTVIVQVSNTPVGKTTENLYTADEVKKGAIDDRWGGTDNVLELRKSSDVKDESIEAMKGGVNATRTGIQFHIKGASDGCLMAAGTSQITFNPGVTINTCNVGSSSGNSQTNFTQTIKDFRNADTNASKSGYIKVTFQKGN